MSQEQLGFGFEQMAEEQRTAYLPSTMEDAIPYYRGLLEKYHAAMLARDLPAIEKINQDAQDLAVKLNGGKLLGIMGGPEAPVYALERATAVPTGTVPMWGQTGDFIVSVDNMRIRVEQDGIFGIGARMSPAPGFSANAVDFHKPFLSETGYRSFVGYRPDFEPGMTPDVLAQEMIRAYINGECKGKTKKIQQTYVEREMARREEKANLQQRQPQP